jgi:hypothetical protein
MFQIIYTMFQFLKIAAGDENDRRCPERNISNANSTLQIVGAGKAFGINFAYFQTAVV